MHGVNCWLMGLSFLLGLLLTFAFTIRRVKREVPVSAAYGAAGAAASAPTAPIPTGGAGARPGSAAKPPGGLLPSEAETTAMAIGGAPYGVGSARAGAGGIGPAGWTIKGNEDSMLYHAPASPAYDATIAEVWFKDEQTAAAAGFQRWDSWRKDKKKKK